MSDCVFCKIVAGDIPSVKVYEDADTLALMDLGMENSCLKEVKSWVWYTL